jgi:hypothetical protein
MRNANLVFRRVSCQRQGVAVNSTSLDLSLHFSDYVSQPQTWIRRINGKPILDLPNGRQDGLRKTPVEGSFEIELQLAREPFEPSLDRCGREKQVWFFNWIP